MNRDGGLTWRPDLVQVVVSSAGSMLQMSFVAAWLVGVSVVGSSRGVRDEATSSSSLCIEVVFVSRWRGVVRRCCLFLRILVPSLVSTMYDRGSFRILTTDPGCHVWVLLFNIRMGWPRCRGWSSWPFLSLRRLVRCSRASTWFLSGSMRVGRVVTRRRWNISSPGLGVLESMGVARRWSKARFTSIPDSKHFLMICFTVPTILSAKPLDLGYRGLDVICSILQSSTNCLNRLPVYWGPLSEMIVEGHPNILHNVLKCFITSAHDSVLSSHTMGNFVK